MLEDANVKKDTDRGEPQKQSSFIFLGWACAIISILFYPVFVAALGVIFGYLAKKMHGFEIHGTIIIIASIACGITGMLLGAALA